MIWTGLFALVEAGPARNPEAGACPGAGRIAGYGPVLGLNGVEGAAAVGTLGFVDAMNWGFVKFRQESNSTVDPRYCEHLSPNVTPAMKGTSHTISMDLEFNPMTTPLTDSGTPPESCTIVTRSPRAKC